VGERRRDGFGERPWSSLFDPAANVRALGDIQRRGLWAAGELVDRLVGDDNAAATSANEGERDAADRAHRDGLGGSGARAEPAGAPATAQLFQLWVDLFRQGVQAVSDATVTPAAPTSAKSPRGATVDLGAGLTTGTVRIDAPGGGRDGGGSTEAEVWLHNGTAEPRADVSLHCGDLRAHDGSLLPASAVRFDPDRVDDLPARSSRGVVVSAVLDAEWPPGVYRGLILATGAPDVWLPLEVVVGDSER
jgi:hypothetical protein